MRIKVLACFARGPPNEIKKRGLISFLDFVFSEVEDVLVWQIHFDKTT